MFTPPPPAVPPASAPAPTGAGVQIRATFVDTTTGRWTFHQPPVLARQPTVVDLRRRGRAPLPDEFGLSFNCQVGGGGQLQDCRSIYATAKDDDPTEIIRSLARSIQVSRESAAIARAKAYRVTIDAAIYSLDPPDGPRSCRPPFCSPTPPPPPPAAEATNPVLRLAMAHAGTCFSSRWEVARVQRFAAEKAVREITPETGSDAARIAALAYVRGRQALMECISDLESTGSSVPLDVGDTAMLRERLKRMKASHLSQVKYQTAILAGVLDREVGRAELKLDYP